MAENWLRELRLEANLTQEELASQLQLEGYDVTRATVAHWEQGRNRLPLKDTHFINALSKVLRVPVANIMQYAGYLLRTKHSELAERAAHIIDELPPDKQELAVRLVEQLKR